MLTGDDTLMGTQFAGSGFLNYQYLYRQHNINWVGIDISHVSLLNSDDGFQG